MMYYRLISLLVLLVVVGFGFGSSTWNKWENVQGVQGVGPTALVPIGEVDGKTFYTDDQAVINGTTFWEAMEYCHRLGLYPATITSQAQTQVVINALGSYRPFWLPVTDVGNEGSFRWVRNGQLISGYTDWIPGNPNPIQDIYYNCVYIYPSSTNGTTNTWFNLPCTTYWRPLCEYP